MMKALLALVALSPVAQAGTFAAPKLFAPMFEKGRLHRRDRSHEHIIGLAVARDRERQRA